MYRTSLCRLSLALTVISLVACGGSSSSNPTSSTQTPNGQPDSGQTMMIEGVTMLNDQWVWNTFAREFDSEPVLLTDVVLNTDD